VPFSSRAAVIASWTSLSPFGHQSGVGANRRAIRKQPGRDHGWLLLSAGRRCRDARRGRNTDREAPALGDRRGSLRRGVPTDARVLAGEDTRLQSGARLSKRWSRVVDRRPRRGDRGTDGRPAYAAAPRSLMEPPIAGHDNRMWRNEGEQFGSSFNLNDQR
jgi:hypothetical protein